MHHDDESLKVQTSRRSPGGQPGRGTKSLTWRMMWVLTETRHGAHTGSRRVITRALAGTPSSVSTPAAGSTGVAE